MRHLLIFIFSFIFIIEARSQPPDVYIQWQFYEDTPSDYLDLRVVNSQGTEGPLTGFYQRWSFISDDTFTHSVNPPVRFYLNGIQGILKICLFAYAYADSANTAFTKCTYFYYDSTLLGSKVPRIRYLFFHDKNGNCIKESGEDVLRCPVTFSGRQGSFTSYFQRRDTAGIYLESDTYNIEIEHPDAEMSDCFWKKLVCDSNTAKSVQLIPLKLLNSHPDWAVYLSRLNGWSPGFTGKLGAYISNKTLITGSHTLKLQFPDSVVLLNASVPISTQSSGYAAMDFNNLSGLEPKDVHLNFRISENVYTNKDTVEIIAWFESFNQEPDTLDNRMSLKIPLNGSFDPNDKMVFGRHPMDTDFPAEYRIRFQNTGNGPASRVIIRDTLPEEADPASVKIMSVSHRMQMNRDDNKLEFRFDDIILPDSGSDLAGSQGYVRFSVFLRKEGSQVTYDSIINRASIYFDFNVPVATGDAVLYAAVAPVNHIRSFDNGRNYELFPNPGKRDFTIIFDTQFTPEFIEVYNLSGKLILRRTLSDATGEAQIHLPEFIPDGTYIVRTSDGAVLRWLLLR